VEFEQALRSLYRVAWPKATPEQKEAALKTRFEEGLVSHEMQQLLRLHALGDTFANTVQKARRFAATTEVPRTRKSVRITTPPAHESVQLIKEDSALEKRLDKLESIIESLQVTGIRAVRETPPPKSSTVTCVTNQPQRQFPASRSSGEALGKPQDLHKIGGALFGHLMLTLIHQDRLRLIDPLVDPASLRGGVTRTRTW